MSRRRPRSAMSSLGRCLLSVAPRILRQDEHLSADVRHDNAQISTLIGPSDISEVNLEWVVIASARSNEDFENVSAAVAGVAADISLCLDFFNHLFDGRMRTDCSAQLPAASRCRPDRT